MFESSLCPQGLHYFIFSVPQRQYSEQIEDPCGKFHANRQRQYRYYTSRCCLLRIVKVYYRHSRNTCILEEKINGLAIVEVPQSH